MIDRFGTHAELFDDTELRTIVCVTQPVDVEQLSSIRSERQRHSVIAQRARAAARAFERQLIDEIEGGHRDPQ